MNLERDFDRFRDVVVATAEALGTQISAQRVAIYFEDLCDLDIDVIVRAFAQHRRESEFFPSIAKIRNLVLGDPKDLAVLAWDRYVAAVRHIGSYESVDFSDPVMHAVIDALGGWQTQAERLPDITMQADAFGYQRHEFIERYRAYGRKLPGRTRPYLPGIFELTNIETRGLWTHALAHRERVLTLSEDGLAVIGRRALGSPMTETKALPEGESLTLERVQQIVKEFTEKFGALPRRPVPLPDGPDRPSMEQDPFAAPDRTAEGLIRRSPEAEGGAS